MKYPKVRKAIFLERPNRFIARVELDGEPVVVHVKNTGRCKELLLPGTTVWLAESDQPARKTKYDLIAVEKQRSGKPDLLINMDSQAPNQAAEEWLKNGALFGKEAIVRREVTHGSSRFDFYIESGARKIFLEVKGCTLERDGLAFFPDAPTERGVKHIRELTSCLQEGYEAYILMVIQMKDIRAFSPNDETHPAFGDALREAVAKGVRLIAMDCTVAPSEMKIDSPVQTVL